MDENLTINEQQFTVAETQKMIDAGLFGTAEKHTATNNPSASVPHGLWFRQNVAGLFTRPGAEPGMFSTLTQPDGIFLNALRGTSALTVMPEYDIFSGVLGCQGSNGSDFCSDAPSAGFGKLCTTSSRFGAMWIKTHQVELNKIGGRINRADVDKNLINNPLVYPFMPEIVTRARNINSQLGFETMALGVTTHRWLTHVIFHGVYGMQGGNAHCGFNMEFDGFDRLIRTGYLDIVSGNHCSSADSRVINWLNNLACGTLQGYTLVDTMSWLMNYLQQKADAQGLTPTDWVVAMHPNLFNALVQCWPCDYNTAGCNMRDTNSERTVTGTELTNARDMMRQGSFLPVNGANLPVWQTSAIGETVNGAGFSSPLYVIPLSSLGMKTTYLEWFNQNNADIQEYVGADRNIHYTSMNDGFWAMTDSQQRMCQEWYFAAQPRLIMRTPWLAARIENINYGAAFNLFQDSPYPGDIYHRDGGRYSEDPPYHGGDWRAIGHVVR